MSQQKTLALANQQIEDSERTLQQVVSKMNESARIIAVKNERFVHHVNVSKVLRHAHFFAAWNMLSAIFSFRNRNWKTIRLSE